MSQSAAPRARRSGVRAPRGAPLSRAFYDRDPALVARELLGAVLECRSPEGVASGRIVETEAYVGPHDPACHAVFGNTPRTKSLFAPAGTSYVYLIYGMYWCFNAVTREEGFGSAVLVRALEPLGGEPLMHARRPRVKSRHDLTNGPGKLCLALGIDSAHDGLTLDEPPLRILSGQGVPDDEVLVSPRIGITKAADWPLRFFIAGNSFVSKTPRSFASKTYAP
jgi:DNA-3-methyladenine glycosylase